MTLLSKQEKLLLDDQGLVFDYLLCRLNGRGAGNPTRGL